MKILVTGSSGVLGINLVNHLLEKEGVEVKGFDISECHSAHKGVIEHVQGDILNKDDLDRACAGVDAIVHAASASPAFTADKIEAIVVEGTRNLLEAAKNNNIDRFVYVSSTAVYGIPDNMPMLETDPIQPYHDPYNVSKSKAETICANYRNSDLSVCILRPRTFLGPQRLGTFAMLFEWALEGRNFPMLGSGTNRYQFLDVYDLCEAISLALIKPKKLVSDTFNIGAKSFGSMTETYQAVLDAAGFNKKIICLPAKPILVVLDFLSMLRLSPLYKRLYQKLNRDYFASIEKAEQVLGFTPKYSNTETLVRCFNWYREHKNTLPTSIGTGNNQPWDQGLLKFGKIFF